MCVPGSPVIIVAGALLFDTKTSSALAQLKLQNMTKEEIQIVAISLRVFDSNHAEIEGIKRYQYLDVKAGQVFGENKAILLTDNEAFSFVVSGIEVVFSDGSQWTMDDEATLETQFDREVLRNKLQEDDLVAEYCYEVSRYANTLPKQGNYAWLCACGAANTGEECVKCGADKQIVFKACNPGYLRAQIDYREVQKRIEREEKIAAAKKNRCLGQSRQADCNQQKGKKGRYHLFACCCRCYRDFCG